MTQQFKILIPIGGAAVFAGIAGYIFYKLYQKDELEEHEKNKLPLVKLTKVEIKIPKSAVGAVIGRHGANIKQIQEKTNTSINFNDEGEKERLCIIRGKIEKVEKAKELILKAVEDLPVIEKLELNIPKECIGRVIGRGGESVNNLQRTTGAKIKVCNEPNTNDVELEEGPLSEPTRKIIIKGTEQQIAAAKMGILEKVAEEKKMRNQIQNSVSNISHRAKSRQERRRKENGHLDESFLPEEESNIPVESASTFPSMPNKLFTEVFVSAVDTSTHFWVQVLGSKTIALDKLVTEMTNYYDDSGHRELHTPDYVLTGDIVAAKFPADNMWYRGRILEVCGCESGSKYIIYFVDFGDTDTVDSEFVLELRTDFLQLGFQAVECYLANIDHESASSQEALEAFESLTYASQWKPVMSQTLGYKQEGNNTIACVKIVDTSGPENCDIDVAEELVKRGLAKWNEDETPNPSSSLNSIEEVSNSTSSSNSLEEVPNS